MSRRNGEGTSVGNQRACVRRLFPAASQANPSARLWRTVAVLATAGAAACAPGLAADDDTPRSARHALHHRLQRAIAASVLVLVDGHMAGSGAFVSPDGIVLTAEHVIRNASRLQVVDTDGHEYAARALAVDRGHDVALLAAEAARPSVWLTTASRAPRLGERLFLLGHPLYRHRTVTPGWVAGDRPTFEHVDGRYIEVLHIAGISARGASGGPWLNAQGQVVGVQSSMMSVGEIPQGLLFAAPLEAVRSLLKTRRDAVVADLGVAVEELWEKPPEVIRKYPAGLRGLYVAAVKENGPARRAGLKAGVVVVAVDGKPIRFRDELLRAIRKRKPGETLLLKIVQPDSGDARELRIPLAPLSDVVAAS